MAWKSATFTAIRKNTRRTLAAIASRFVRLAQGLRIEHGSGKKITISWRVRHHRLQPTWNSARAASSVESVERPNTWSFSSLDSTQTLVAAASGGSACDSGSLV